MASETRSVSVRITKPEEILAMRDGCLTFNAVSESYYPDVNSWSAKVCPRTTMSMVIQHPLKRFPAEVYQPGGIVMTRLTAECVGAGCVSAGCVAAAHTHGRGRVTGFVARLWGRWLVEVKLEEGVRD